MPVASYTHINNVDKASGMAKDKTNLREHDRGKATERNDAHTTTHDSLAAITIANGCDTILQPCVHPPVNSIKKIESSGSDQGEIHNEAQFPLADTTRTVSTALPSVFSHIHTPSGINRKTMIASSLISSRTTRARSHFSEFKGASVSIWSIVYFVYRYQKNSHCTKDIFFMIRCDELASC